MFSLLCAVVFALGATTLVAADRLAITPHDSYSSSIGVLGCKINTDRVAYWPMAVDCDDICVRVSHGGRSVDLLRIDQSTGAHDISYDAWNYLVTGRGAAEGAATGGPVEMEVQRIPADNCLRHIRTGNGGLPLSAPNSINFLAACLARPDSWVARRHRLFNIQDPVCHWGHDEVCRLDLAASNQPSCPHPLGSSGERLPDTVFNLEYGTGRRVPAA